MSLSVMMFRSKTVASSIGYPCQDDRRCVRHFVGGECVCVCALNEIQLERSVAKLVDTYSSAHSMQRSWDQNKFKGEGHRVLSSALPVWVCMSTRLHIDLVIMSHPTIGALKRCCDPSVRPTIGLSVCLSHFLILSRSLDSDMRVWPFQTHSKGGSKGRLCPRLNAFSKNGGRYRSSLSHCSAIYCYWNKTVHRRKNSWFSKHVTYSMEICTGCHLLESLACLNDWQITQVLTM